MQETDFDRLMKMLANAVETSCYTVRKYAQEKIITFERDDSWYNVAFYFNAEGKLLRVE